MKTDPGTSTAFRRLWDLWSQNLSIGDNPEKWDGMLDKITGILAEARRQNSIDITFIECFAEAVLNSLDRLNSQE